MSRAVKNAFVSIAKPAKTDSDPKVAVANYFLTILSNNEK